MATSRDLCASLGFGDVQSGLRGSEDILLHDIWSFCISIQGSINLNDAEGLAARYLNEYGAARRFWEPMPGFSWNEKLTWPRDSLRITGIIEQLLPVEIKKLLDNRFIVNGPTLIEDNRSAPTEQQSSSGSQLPKAVHLEPSRGLTEGNASSTDSSDSDRLAMAPETTTAASRSLPATTDNVKEEQDEVQFSKAHHPVIPPLSCFERVKHVRLPQEQNDHTPLASKKKISNPINPAKRLQPIVPKETGKRPPGLGLVPSQKRSIKRWNTNAAIHGPTTSSKCKRTRLTKMSTATPAPTTPENNGKGNQQLPTPLATPGSPHAPHLLTAPKINLHFFLADANHGAIVKNFNSCKTMTSFFKEALTAYNTLGDTLPNMVAVKVVIDDISRPMIVLWKDKEGFANMLDAISEAAEGHTGVLNVEVTCLMKR